MMADIFNLVSSGSALIPAISCVTETDIVLDVGYLCLKYVNVATDISYANTSLEHCVTRMYITVKC